ncbi:pantothenate transporter [Diplocarpon rosae]|nr:pantothenate transporter [Diplocarpon rosae]
MGFSKRVRDYVHQPYEHPGEGKLVRKLDFFILTFCCLMYFTNYLDRSNLANAYVSGLKEELGFKGSQYNLINTVFTVGYVNVSNSASPVAGHQAARLAKDIAAALPGINTQMDERLSLYHLKPRIFFPGMIIIWGGLTMLTAAAKNPRHIMAIRFFQGIAESSTFVGTHYILGSWYTGREIGKRSGIFTASGLAGTMVGGFLQTAINSSLNGAGESFSSNSLLALYMKSTKKYSIPQLNNYPTGVPAVGIMSTLFWATLTDFLGGKRYLVGYWIGITGVATAAMILSPNASVSTTFGAYYWAGSVYACQATFFAWANDAMRLEEDSLRAVVIASMNCASNAVNAWWSLLFYAADMAPKFRVVIKKGMWAMIATSIALAIWTTGLLYMTIRADKRRAVEEEREPDTTNKSYEAEAGENKV